MYGLGQCALDYIGKIDAYPPPDVKCEFSDMVIQGGGPVATALVALARWGLSCVFAGVLGDDLFSSMIKASLDGEGIDTSGVLVRKGFDSQFAFIVAEPGSGRRTIFWRRPTGPPPSPDEINYSIISRAKVVLTDGLFLEAALAACTAARKAGGHVVVDAGSLREGMLDLARLSDYFIASETFATALVGDDKPMEACKRLAELGPRVVGVTLGPRGYVALAQGKVIKKSAYPVEAIDTTGCGDVFHAGFIYGLIQGWDIEKSLDFAAWAAAMVSRKLGGRAGIPSLKALLKHGY
ncbi:MAG: sugar kinase [Deltaproteobacteria bacterium]|nr:sugar kinase [Deltaproteobacteria bacterium]MBW2073851.1 sugar kinase [Deltaproteobacteria bacterium]